MESSPAKACCLAGCVSIRTTMETFQAGAIETLDENRCARRVDMCGGYYIMPCERVGGPAYQCDSGCVPPSFGMISTTHMTDETEKTCGEFISSLFQQQRERDRVPAWPLRDNIIIICVRVLVWVLCVYITDNENTSQTLWAAAVIERNPNITLWFVCEKNRRSSNEIRCYWWFNFHPEKNPNGVMAFRLYNCLWVSLWFRCICTQYIRFTIYYMYKCAQLIATRRFIHIHISETCCN